MTRREDTSRGYARRVVVVTNQKGGVGKTTLVRELGLALAVDGLSVLLIDSDAQGNLTRSLVETKDPDIFAGQSGSAELAAGLEGDESEPLKLRHNVDLLAGGRSLSFFERRYYGEVDCYHRLKKLLEREVFEKYELILIDTPPSLGILTVNALAAANGLLIPMSPAQYTMQGTNELLSTVTKSRETLNGELDLIGAMINMLDPVPVIVREIVQEIRGSFGPACFEAIITKSIRIEEAIAEKQGIVELPGAPWKKCRDEIIAAAAELKGRLW
jgi:chromosome partitioning protein